MNQAKKNPPATAHQGIQDTATALITPSLSGTAHDIDPIGLVAGVWVAVVEVRGDHVPPRYRRRTYWNLPAAQRAIDKAHMDGLEAHVILCQLIPAGGAR